MESNTSKKFIIGLGNPIVDISATSDEETLQKYGLEFGKTVFRNEQNEGYYDVLEAQKDVTYIPGGSVTNSIRITNWLLNGSEQYGCMLLGCIGNDSYGEKIQAELTKAGVQPLLETTEEHKSSRCGVAIHLKERCLMPDIRASSKLSMEFVQKNIDAISSADILLIEGYFVIERYEIVKHLASHFLNLNKQIAFTLSATFMIDNFPDKMLEISNLSHIIFCNNEEAAAFSKNNSENYEEISTVIHQMLTPLNRILVITCGSKPVVISRYDYNQNKIDFILNSTVFPVDMNDIVDTNGCGDSFVGGFLSQYIQGRSLEKCARAGNTASSVIIKNVGCTYPDNFRVDL